MSDTPLTEMKEKFTFFWNGPFSQWYPSPFKIECYIYNCAEQYMMVSKALLFKDYESSTKILSTTDPKLQKLYGRQVKGFDKNKWEEHAKEIVFRGNMAKFTQDEDLKELLLATKGTILVEASPYDKIWGIGLQEDDPLAQDRATWKGTNWLGYVLTEVRKEIEKTL